MEHFKTTEKNVLGNIIEENAKVLGDKTFIIYEDKEISYNQLSVIVNKIANGFIKIGIKKGDKVAIMMDNCPEFIYTWFALSKIGAIEIPINVFHKGDVLKYLINYSDAEILVLDEGYIQQIKKIENDLINIKLAIIYPLSAEPKLKKIPIKPYNSLLNNSFSPPEVKVRYNDLMAILFTSGTTGLSKGVMLTHNQMIFQGYMYSYTCRITEDDRMYQYLPLYHEAGQCGGTLAPLLAKAAIVLRKSFSASKFWDEIKGYKITISGGFEPIIRILYRLPPQENDKDHFLRVFACGHVPPDIHEDFQNRFNVKLIDAYGMTETDMSISATIDNIKIGACGKSHAEYFDVKLFDGHDMEVPLRTPGEIVIRPRLPNIIMEGYYKMPEKTLDIFRNLWFHTGDLAYKDEEDYYYFVDRKKDMVRRAGENISSKELEEIINSNENVKECAVVGVKDLIVGEEIKAAIVLKQGRSVAPEDLIEYCDERMAYFMVPRYIEFLEELPKQLDGHKIIKERLKEINSNSWDRKKAGIKLKREKEKDNK